MVVTRTLTVIFKSYNNFGAKFKVQVAVFAFDLLYLNGEAFVSKPFKDRRQLLQDRFHAAEGGFHFAKSAEEMNENKSIYQ